MVIICTTSGDMIPMENGLNYHALEPWNLLPYLKLNQETGVGVLRYLAEQGCAALMGRFFTRNP